MIQNVDIGPEGEAFIQAELESGRYNSAEEVLREALQLLQAQHVTEDEILKAALPGIERGLADVAAGRVAPYEQVFEELRSELEAKARSPE